MYEYSYVKHEIDIVVRSGACMCMCMCMCKQDMDEHIFIDVFIDV